MLLHPQQEENKVELHIPQEENKVELHVHRCKVYKTNMHKI